jgi:hypothetical protein
MSRERRMVRKPAIKFPQLRKKLEKARPRATPIQRKK